MSRVDELRLDIDELSSLLRQATRPRVKDALSLELRRLQTDLSKFHADPAFSATRQDGTNTDLSNPPAKKCYEVKLNNYGWDQTRTTVKLYVSLQDVHKLPKENVICNFADKSVDLRVLNLDGKNYHLTINNLCEEIDAETSCVKTKSDMVVVQLAKRIAKDWSHVTGVEKRIKEAKSSTMSDIGEDADPGASLMNLMKKMYQDGDDEMKKTIAKAWTESQQKSAAGISDYP